MTIGQGEICFKDAATLVTAGFGDPSHTRELGLTEEWEDAVKLEPKLLVDDLRSWISPRVSKQASKSTRFRLMILAPLAVFLAWQVVTRSVAAYLADARPEMAIRLRSTNPPALVNLAEAKLSAAQRAEPVVTSPPREASPPTSDLEGLPGTQDLDPSGGSGSLPSRGAPPRSGGADPQTNAQIRAWAELALLNDPLNARAYGILGQLAQLTPDDKRTETLMQAAARRSVYESDAVYWMMRKSYQDQDYRAAIRYADTLLRTRHEGMVYVIPVLGRIAENPGASGELKQFLADNPPWRTKFFEYLPASISDARTPLDIFLSLKDTPTPPTAADLGSYLNFLIGHGFYDLAYYTWLQFLPSEQLSKVGHLFNGSFEVAPSGLPFDWVFAQRSGVTIKVAARPDQAGEHALYLEFGPGRVDLPDIAQLIILPPGSYQFQGKYKVNIDSQRGLRWRLTCANGPTTRIGESPVVKGSELAWKNFVFSFTVPETDCPAQYVRLAFDARWASEQFISGSIWFDDLQIVRDPGVDPSIR